VRVIIAGFDSLIVFDKWHAYVHTWDVKLYLSGINWPNFIVELVELMAELMVGPVPSLFVCLAYFGFPLS
jgi:hypothetical protein